MAHGGGYRCQTEGCDKQYQGGGRCIAHGGGRRHKASSPFIPEAKGLSEDKEVYDEPVEADDRENKWAC